MWQLVVIASFTIGSALALVSPLAEPGIIGSHAVIYTDAARAWLARGDPWSVGPPAAVFAGPPPMLLAFVPFIGFSDDAVRLIWVVGTALIALWTIRRLGLPGYWIGYPPLFGAILLGHPEVLVLGFLVLGGPASGLAGLIKPYAVFPLIAERRWRAIAVLLALGVVTLPILPWGQFLAELPRIAGNLASQARGDSTFGNPPAMVLAVACLAVLGPRRALWLATPLLWPSAQGIYKVVSLPATTPLLAVAWALPFPGATLIGIVIEALLVLGRRYRSYPAWLQSLLDQPAMRRSSATASS